MCMVLLPLTPVPWRSVRHVVKDITTVTEKFSVLSLYKQEKYWNKKFTSYELLLENLPVIATRKLEWIIFSVLYLQTQR